MLSLTLQTTASDTILFIGGGAVAERRLALCLQEPCQCIVISPVITEQMQAWHEDDRFIWHNTIFTDEHIDMVKRCKLLFICTDNKTVNDYVEAIARKYCIWLNRADDATSCDFTVPSTIDIGDLHIAISANNGGPRINRLVKRDMMNRYSELQIAIPRLKIMREEVKLLIPSVEERSQFWRTHLGESEFQAILKGQWPLIEEKLHHAISGIRTKS